MKPHLVRSGDLRDWDLGGREVTQLIIDPNAFRFVVWTQDGSVEIRLETPFELQTPDGQLVVLDPASTAELVPILRLLGLGVNGIVASEVGRLEVRFVDDTRIISEPHPAFEAWQTTGDGDLSRLNYLCGPGGGSPWG